MNTLTITPDAFDRKVWNGESGFTKKQYNEWLKNAAKSLQVIYNKADESDLVDPQDLYVLGDVINILSDTKIVISKK